MEVALETFGQAIALWREPFGDFGGFGDEPCLAAEVTQRYELFLSTLEEWAELELDRDCAAVLDVLSGHVRSQLLRERLGGLWMRALASAGRANEALAHYGLVSGRWRTSWASIPARSWRSPTAR